MPGFEGICTKTDRSGRSVLLTVATTWLMACVVIALAAYNAGPSRAAQLRREAKRVGLDPDVWFDNVEVMAARKIGRETVQYVSNIYKYYLAHERFNVENKRKGRL